MSEAAVLPNSTVPNSEMVSVLTADYLSTSQVASLLDVTKWTLADWRLKRQGPPFELKARGVVVYSAEGLNRYLRTLPEKDFRGTRAGAAPHH